jgi:hypothetical protein
MTRYTLQPLYFAEAAEHIRRHHRHHTPPVSWLFGIGANDGSEVVGVLTVGRPVARHRDDGWTAEVTRCCVRDDLAGVAGHANSVASMLYSAAWRACRAMGYRRLGTYTLKSEPGTSLVAAGWRVVGEVRGRSWNCPSRPRVDVSPTDDKLLWEPVASGMAPAAPAEGGPTHARR